MDSADDGCNLGCRNAEQIRGKPAALLHHLSQQVSLSLGSHAADLFAEQGVWINPQRMQQLCDGQSAGVFVAEASTSPSAETLEDAPPVGGVAGGAGDFFWTR